MPASSVAVAAAVIIVVVPCPLATLNHRSGKYLLRAFAAFYFWVSFRFTVGQVPKQSGGLHLRTIYLSLSPSLLLTVSPLGLLACLLGSCSAFACAYFECAHFDHVIEIFTFKTWPKYICFCMYVFRSPLVTSNGAFSPFNLQWNLFNTLLQWCVPSRPRPAPSSGCGRLYYCFFMLLPLVFSLCFSLTLSVSRGSVFLFQSTTNGEC